MTDPVVEELRRRFAPQSETIRAVIELCKFDARLASLSPKPQQRKNMEIATDQKDVTTPEPPTPAAEAPVKKRRISKKLRVHWTKDEKESFFARLGALMITSGVFAIPSENDRRGVRRLGLFARKVQEAVLPPNRHRTMVGYAGIFSTGVAEADSRRALLNKYMNEAAARIAVTKTPIQTVPPPAAFIAPASTQDTPTSKAAPSLAEVLAIYFTDLEQTIATQKTTISELTQYNQILTEEASALRSRCDSIEFRLANFENGQKAAAVVDKKGLPKVAIVGCLKHQFEEISDKAEASGLRLDLRHISTDASPHPFSAEWAIMMKFISHSWIDQVKTSVPSGQSTFTRGGITQIVQQLQMWFA